MRNSSSWKVVDRVDLSREAYESYLDPDPPDSVEGNGAVRAIVRVWEHPPLPEATPLLRRLRSLVVEAAKKPPVRVYDELGVLMESMLGARDLYEAQVRELPGWGDRERKTLGAMEGFLEAAERMLRFLEDGDASHLQAGLLRAEEADLELQGSLRPDPDDRLSLDYLDLVG